MEKQYVMTTFILLATLTLHYYTNLFLSNLSLNECFKFLKQLDNRLINFKRTFAIESLVDLLPHIAIICVVFGSKYFDSAVVNG